MIYIILNTTGERYFAFVGSNPTQVHWEIVRGLFKRKELPLTVTILEGGKEDIEGWKFK